MSTSETSLAPDERSIQFLLDQLTGFRSHRDALAVDKQILVDSVMTPEILAKLSDIDTEFADKFAAVDRNTSALESQIRAAVLVRGSTVKGTSLQAVWSKGHTTWDTKKFDDYALTHPDVLAFRDPGEPSVSIKVIKSAK